MLYVKEFVVLGRLNALVADSMHTRKEQLYSVPSVDGFALVVYIASLWPKAKQLGSPRPNIGEIEGVLVSQVKFALCFWTFQAYG